MLIEARRITRDFKSSVERSFMILEKHYLRLPEEISYLHKFATCGKWRLQGIYSALPLFWVNRPFKRDVTLNSLKAFSGGVSLGGVQADTDPHPKYLEDYHDFLSFKHSLRK